MKKDKVKIVYVNDKMERVFKVGAPIYVTEELSLISKLIEALREDQSEGSYYHSWKANIAMAFEDVISDSDEYLPGFNTSKYANQAAENFLQQLIS